MNSRRTANRLQTRRQQLCIKWRVDRAWTSLVRQRVVVKVWHSLSVEDLVKIPPSGYVCPGFRPKTVFNYGKGTTTPWRKLIRRHIVAEHRQDGDAYRGLLWRPQGSPYRAYLARTPRSVLSGISKIRPMAAAFITATEVPTTHHGRASVVLIVAVSRKYCQSNATDGRNLRATVS